MEKLKRLHWLIAFLIIALIAAGVYIVNKELKDDETYIKENTSKEDVKEENNEKESCEECPDLTCANITCNDISKNVVDDVGKELYKLIDSSLSTYYFFEEENMNQSSFSDEEKLALVLYNIDLSDIYFDYVNYDELKQPSTIGNFCYDDICTVYNIPVAKFEKNVEDLWGQNNNIRLEAFGGVLGSCWFSEDNYYLKCVIPSGFGDDSDAYPSIEYAGAKMVGTSIVVSVRFIYMSRADDKLYADLKNEKEIEIKDEDKEFLKSFDSKSLFEKYGDKAGIFEVTFKKDSTGNYYYYSTEYVR